MTKKEWQVFQLSDLLQGIEKSKVDFLEFLRVPTLSCAIYHLPADSTDMQGAHDVEEVYFVLEGRARLRVGEDVHEVKNGTLLYVHTECDHAFFDIEEDLTVLVFFGSGLTKGIK